MLEPIHLWGPIFNDYNIENEIKIECVVNNHNESMKIKHNENYNRPAVPVQPLILPNNPQIISTNQNQTTSSALDITYNMDGRKVQESHLTIGPTGLELFIDFSYNKPTVATFNPSRMRTNPLEDSNRYSELDIIGKSDIILNYLRIIDTRINRISIITIGNEPILHCDIGIGRKIPVAFLGDGISRFLTLLLQIVSGKCSVILVDEIENGIHYSVMAKVWESIAMVAKDFDCQIISTTHSYECLRAAYAGIPENMANEFRYIRLERDENNLITSNIYDYKMLGTALYNNWEVR